MNDLPQRYRDMLGLTVVVARFPTKDEALDLAHLLGHASVFYSDGSERPEGWEVWQ